MDDLLKYLSTNKDGLSLLAQICGVFIAAPLTFIGVAKFFGSMIFHLKKRNVKSENFPFKVISPQSNVVREIYGDDISGPLADHRIPYQTRVSKRNIRRELEDLLDVNRWILVFGRTGIGKTREAAVLAQSLNNEGWTILYMTRDKWLEVPTIFPSKVGNDRKLLFFLDDLNRKIYASRFEKPPRAKEELQLKTEPLQERLRATIEFFERSCGKDEIRVIATARSEKIARHQDEPSEWKKLELKKYADFWNKFSTNFLPEPSDESIANLLADVAKTHHVDVKTDDIQLISERNDRTFQNIVLNLKRSVNLKQPLEAATFEDTLNGTWRKRYFDVIEKYPVATYIYDAREVLQDLFIEPTPIILESVSRLMVVGNMFEKIRLSWQIRRALRYLVYEERILNPRDGQVDAKINHTDWKEYAPAMVPLFISLARRHPRSMYIPLIDLGNALSEKTDYVKSAESALYYATLVYPNNPVAYTIPSPIRAKKHAD